MHSLYLFLVLLLCFLGALSNVGGIVFLKLFFQETHIYTLFEIDTLSSICILIICFYQLLQFRKASNKKLTNRPELVGALCIGAVIGSTIGTITYFYIYHYHGEQALISLQNIIIFALTLNSLLYSLFSSFVQTFDIRKYFPCLVSGLLLGFLCSLSSVGLLFLMVLVPLILFDTTYQGAKNISIFVLFFALSARLIVSYLIVPVQLTDIPYILPVIILSFLGNVSGTYFRTQLNETTRLLLYNFFLILIILLSMFNFR